MSGFFQRLLGNDNHSKQVAKERLRLVLVQDRMSLSPRELGALKEELIAVISKYMDIDDHGIEVDLQREGDSGALVATIPVKRSLNPAQAGK